VRNVGVLFNGNHPNVNNLSQVSSVAFSSSLRVRLRSDLGGCNSTGDRLSTCLQLRYETRSPRLDEIFNDKIPFTKEEHRTVTVRSRHTAATRLSSCLLRPRPTHHRSTSTKQNVRPLDQTKQSTYIGTVQISGLSPTRCRNRPLLAADHRCTGDNR
jgi:hypothetical protein